MRILVIDDEAGHAHSLATAISAMPSAEPVDVATWVPQGEDPEERFDAEATADTTLVVTDYDLSKGTLGLFGSTIVDWCQERLLPCADFSRGRPRRTPSQPDLFELKIPTRTVQEGAQEAISLARGFTAVFGSLGDMSQMDSPSNALAHAMDAEDLEPELSQYFTRLGSVGPGVREHLHHGLAADARSTLLRRAMTYVVGHVLRNAVLGFPGPLMHLPGLSAYVGTSPDETEVLKRVFTSALYEGPFADFQSYYWRHKVDDKLEQISTHVPPTEEERWARSVLEAHLDRSLAAHTCQREGCDGINGGFWCPYTNRAVCARADCSVTSDSWIPRGATLTRIERDYFDEWAPILGY